MENSVVKPILWTWSLQIQTHELTEDMSTCTDVTCEHSITDGGEAQKGALLRNY